MFSLFIREKVSFIQRPQTSLYTHFAQLYIGEACWAFLFGVVIGEGFSPLIASNQLTLVGPYGANIFDPRSWGNGDETTVNTITLEFTRVVLAIGVFAIGVELPKAYMKRHWKSLFFLLFPVMTWVRAYSCPDGTISLRNNGHADGLSRNRGGLYLLASFMRLFQDSTSFHHWQ